MFKKTLIILAMLFAILGPGAKAWGQTYEKVMELDMTTKEVGCAAYNTTTTYGDWKIKYGANNNKGWAYFKMGGKSSTLSTCNPCYIYSTEAATKQIDKITVSIPAGSLSSNKMKVNSWGVYVYSDSNMATQIDFVAGGTITKNAATFDFYPSDDITWASGYFYKVSWDLANTSTTNGIVCVDKITLYKASTPSHTLTFSATNGSISAMNGETVIESGDNVEEGATLNITAMANDWYKFSGWNVSGTGSTLGSTTANPTTFTMGTADATLTASFEACSVTVSSNDETMGSATYDATTHIISTSIAKNHRISTTEPYKIVPADAATLTAGDDDTFVVSGVKDQDVEITINFEALPTATYTVTFNAGTNGTCSTTELTEEEACAGVTLPDCTPNTGFVFKGWATTNTATTADAGVAGETYYPTEDITLYAVYNSVYTINYMVNGVNTDAQENVLEGTPLVFPTVTAPDADHVFRGWVTEAIEGTTDTEPAYVNTTGLTATQNITYYAVFAERSGSEPAEQKTQTLQYDTWTYYGSTTDKDTYRLFHSGSYIESAEFDLSKLTKVIVYGGTFGGGSNNSLTIGDGTNTWKSVTVSGSSQTGTNTYTDGTPLSGTGKLRITSNSGTASGTGVRISKVEIFTMEGGYTYSNFCTTVVTKILTSISLSGEYPTEFWKGETFSHEGMIVTAHYSNAPDADVTSKATFSTPDMTTAGEQEVTVTYDTKQAKYNITVKTIVNTQETAYTVAEAKSLIDANPAELATTEVYVKGTVSQVDSYNSTYHSITYWISEDGTTTNQFEVYSGKNLNNTDFASKDDVKVGDDVVVYGIIKKFNSTYEFDKNNYIVSHVKASTLSIDDITVEINGDITPVIETNVVGSYTMSYTSDNENVVLADGDEMVTMGLGTATVTATLTAEGYKKATTTFKVTVIKALESIAVKTAPTTTSYKEGDFFNPAGLVITANYNDESTEDVTYAENEDKFTFTPSLETPLTKENTSVTITYAGKEATQTITVRELYTYDITWMANGKEFITTEVTEGDALGTLPTLANENIPNGFAFRGWSENEIDLTNVEPTYITAETVPTDDMTLYAVFAIEHKDIQETTSTMDFSEETYSDWIIDENIKRTADQGTGGTGDYAGRINTNNTYITFNKKVKVESFGFSFKRTSTNSNYNVYIETSTDNETWTAHQTYPMSDFGNGSYTTKTDDTFDGETDLYVRFHCYNTTATRYVDDVIIRYMGEDIAYSNFCTTVSTPSIPAEITDDATIPSGAAYTLTSSITIKSGATLTVNGVLGNADVSLLIIEDGAQLIFNNSSSKDGNINSGVKATFRKVMDQHGEYRDNPNVGWYFLAAPMTDFAVASFVEQAGEGEGHDYDLYKWYIDEENKPIWYNYKANTSVFETNFLSGRGYLAAYETNDICEMKGTLNAGTTFDFTVNSKDNFTLLGNPFTYDLNWSEFTKETGIFDNGFAVVNSETGIIEYVFGDNPIKVGTGFMVYTEDDDATLSFTKDSESSKSNDILALNLFASNGNGEDNTIIVLDDKNGGFAKADNFNTNAPQIYTERLQTKYGIRNFSTNTKEFNVSFKAAGEGSNTIRLETIGEFDYVHLYDKLLDVDVDMLLEGSYAFEASEDDDTHRFIVRIDKGNTGIDENETENFVNVYNGEIHVSGSGEVQIFDVMGRMMHSEVVSGDATISTSNIKGGVYVVRLIGDGWTKAEKIVVRR